MNIFLFGAQGSGKSTIGNYLAEKLGVPFVATGDIFRLLRQEDTETGRMVKSLIDEGTMVPDELTMKIVNERLDQVDARQGFVLDGAPRNLNQKTLLEKNPDVLVLVTLNGEEAIKRLLERARHDDTPQAIKKRLSWYKEQVEPVINYYRNQGVKFVEVDNTPSVEEVQRGLDGLFKN